VRRLVRLKNIAYIGSHGLEVCLPGAKTQLRLSSTLSQWLRGLARDLRKTLAGLRGPWLEQKIAGVAVHYRQADVSTIEEAVKRLEGAARRWRKQFKIQKGRMVFEFVPAGSTTKGTAVRELAKKLRGGSHGILFYFGDDLTDETVFSSLSKRDFGILVGQRRPSRARYCLRSPKEVGEFLHRLGEITI
jgi:trehalose-phosphatase